MDKGEMKVKAGRAAVYGGRAGAWLRNGLELCGVALCLAPAGLWLGVENLDAPGAVAIRAGLSCVLGGVGVCLFRLGRDQAPLA